MKRFVVGCVVFVGLFCGVWSVSAEEQADIGILAALPQELEAVESILDHSRTSMKGSPTVVLGKLGTTKVVATLSGMGKINAASATQRLISDYGVKAVFFSGVGGGISADLEIGDIVFSQKTYVHDYGYLGKEFKVHAPNTLPEIGIGKGSEPLYFDLSLWPKLDGSRSEFPVLVAETTKKLAGSLEKVTVGKKAYVPKIRGGVIATGDQFIAQMQKKMDLRKEGVDLVDMESAALAQVAAQNKIPFFIIRAVSDKAGVEAKLDFKSFFATVAKNNAKVLKALLQTKELAHYFSGTTSVPSTAQAR